MNTELKYDTGKVRMGLCTTQFANAIMGIAKVLTFGALKYPDPETGDRSWKNLDNGLIRYGDALDRHLYKVRESMELGKPTNLSSIDPETGQLHIDHAITNLLFIRTLLYGDKVDLKIIHPKQETCAVSEASSSGAGI